ncbi:hypothetical protein FDJ19_gp061 [Vibrio phage Ceto]|uniref:Uncharacterized protein n=1 Tax=Vibrio phage Ceto TaxID=2570300 RepID=A0A2H5BGH5_9CAUD|nr:hypothetical protein FDJ19_gp061 [Vibrio phage Ceto]AUG85068.1 hypothetical protein CETO_61 [Vibrio phage Ceto]
MGLLGLIFGSPQEIAPTFEDIAGGASELNPMKESPKPRQKTGAAAMMPEEAPLEEVHIKMGGKWYKYVRVDDN